MKAMQYDEVQLTSAAEVRAALQRGDFETASRFIIGMTLHSPNADRAESVCIEAAASSNVTLRGNAILGLGYLARRFGHLNRSRVEPLVTAALSDPEPYVRGHANSAAEDMQHFLHWMMRA